MRQNQHEPYEINKGNQYRLDLGTALKLGLIPNKCNRYRLTPDKIKELFNLDKKKIKRLFFDIETSPMIVYSWRVGYKIKLDYDNIIEEWKIICISYKWEGSDEVHTVSWDSKKQCDKKLLQEFIKIANKADEIIAHNGDRFDIKKIRTRCIYHRIPMFPKYRTLDTLKKSRSGFAFSSNRLDYIAKFLGVGGKVEHEGFGLWKKCMNNDQEALKNMITYCEGDVVVLEDVFITLKGYTLNNTHVGRHNGEEKYSCPNCGSSNPTHLKNTFTAKGTIKRLMECDSCLYVYEISNSSYRNYLDDKQKELLSQ